MLVTVEWIRTKYNEFNKLYFADKLPQDLELKISRSRGSWGCAGYDIDYKKNTVTPTYIAISNFYDSPESVKENTLIHEMIHVLDYVTHPEHYVIKHTPNRYYNAHGTWFQNEALRFKKYGYDITNKATEEEEELSEYSEAEKQRIEKKKSETLVCEVVGMHAVWFCKTDINKVAKILKLIKKYNYWLESFLGALLETRVYKTSDQEYAEMRSCSTQLRGWKQTFEGFEEIVEKHNFELTKKYVIK